MLPSIPFWWHFNIYGWQDCIEILLFSLGIYYLSCWLYQDKYKPLLLHFYSYCGLLIGTHYLHLATINNLLLLFLPITVILFIIIHQNTLQKNSIPLYRTVRTDSLPSEWIDDLVRSALTAVSNNHPFTCIIEKKDSLASFLVSKNNLKTVCNSDLLNLVTTSSLYKNNLIIWIDAQAKIQAFNAQWQKNSLDAWFTDDAQEQEQWLKDALFFTTKTDALFITVTPKTRCFTLIAQGKIIEKTESTKASAIIKTYLGYHNQPLLKGDWYVASNTKTSSSRTYS